MRKNNKRKSGVLLHITSLPSLYGVGMLGQSAYEFVDFLVQAEQSYWQVLPLCQTGYGDSPYQSCSAFSLNPYFIDLDLLCEQGLLKKDDYINVDFGQSESRVNFEKLFNTKYAVLRIAYERFDKSDSNFQLFLKKGEFFQYALFMSIKGKFGNVEWQKWEEEYKWRDEETLQKFANSNRGELEYWQFIQYKALEQWYNLKEYANGHGVKIIGDMPIYVASDSVEVWENKKDYLLDENGYPSIVAGCPPDAFTSDGQLWGNPIYNWEIMQKNSFSWWQKRLEHAMKLFDKVRIDHFRGFSSYYTIKSGFKNAQNGEWKDGFGNVMFPLLEKKIACMDIIAEDLGFIDKKAKKMFKKLGYPGMKILLFAFDGNKKNEHLPTNYKRNFVVYTGTHDNEPLMSFIKNNMNSDYIKSLKHELKKNDIQLESEQDSDVADAIIELAFASKANICILQIQDLLKEDEESRMNLPATVSTKNWSYKLGNNNYKNLVETLKILTIKHGRSNNE